MARLDLIPRERHYHTDGVRRRRRLDLHVATVPVKGTGGSNPRLPSTAPLGLNRKPAGVGGRPTRGI